MPSLDSYMRRALVAAAIGIVALVALLAGHSTTSRHGGAEAADRMSMSMSDASMQKMVHDFYAAHPAHGGSTSSVVADTIFVSNFIFDTDGNLSTQVDTSKILQGQSVLFKWVAGTHTTTSGNPTDPVPGTLWDHPMDSLSPADMAFTVELDSVGTFPYFCRFHGQFFNMRGVVVVRPNPTAVPPTANDHGRAGFLAAPWPNPTHAGANFRFALERAGRAQVSVFDATGRAVATVFDRELSPGTYTGIWDGRNRDGAAVHAGLYYLRLSAAGAASSARVVVTR